MIHPFSKPPNNNSPQPLLIAVRFTAFTKCKTVFSHSQLGVALGFLLPPLLVQPHDDIELIGRDFQLMFYLIAGFTTLLVTLVVLCKFYAFCMLQQETKNEMQNGRIITNQYHNLPFANSFPFLIFVSFFCLSSFCASFFVCLWLDE